MTRTVSLLALFVGIQCLAATALHAEHKTQSSAEARTVVYFKIDDSAVQKLLPAGWVATPGAGLPTGTNLSVVLIENVFLAGPDNKPVPSTTRYGVLVVPAKNEQTGISAPVVVGGFASPAAAAPGAYSVYVPAKIAVAKSMHVDEAGPAISEEIWDISTDMGDRLHFSVTYERGVGTRSHVEPRIYSAANPMFYRIYKVDQVTDLVRSSADSGRMKKLEFTVSGQQMTSIFGSSPEPVAVMSIPAYYREIFLPD